MWTICAHILFLRFHARLFHLYFILSDHYLPIWFCVWFSSLICDKRMNNVCNVWVLCDDDDAKDVNQILKSNRILAWSFQCLYHGWIIKVHGFVSIFSFVASSSAAHYLTAFFRPLWYFFPSFKWLSTSLLLLLLLLLTVHASAFHSV